MVNFRQEAMLRSLSLKSHGPFREMLSLPHADKNRSLWRGFTICLKADTKFRSEIRAGEHRKRDYTEEDGGDVHRATDVDQAFNQLERILCGHLDRRVLVRTVSVSSGDLGWIIPLMKCMLRAKSRI